MWCINNVYLPYEYVPPTEYLLRSYLLLLPVVVLLHALPEQRWLQIVL